MKVFPFVQFEFTHSLGPDPGRYVIPPGDATEAAAADPAAILEVTSTEGESNGAEAPSSAGSDAAPASPDGVAQRPIGASAAGATRGVGAADVLLIGVLAGPTARPRSRAARRLRSVSARDDPRAVSLSLATVVKATRAVEGEREAKRQLDGLRESEEERDAWIDDALAILNLAIRAYRVVATDPYVIEVTRLDPREIRIGYGAGGDVARGRWKAAFAVPPVPAPRLSRAEQARPSEEVAAILSGRTAMLEAEDIALRALLDLEVGAVLRAAVEARAALELARVELAADPSAGGQRVTDLARRSESFAERTRRALEGHDDAELESETRTACEELLGVTARWRNDVPG